ncbi:hypothetical protein RSA5_05210, partial [Rothia kristinae]
EGLVGRSPVEHLIVRSAQWFEFGMNPAAVTEEQDRVRAQDWAIQPLAAASVASFLFLSFYFFFFLPDSNPSASSAASDLYKRGIPGPHGRRPLHP